MKKLLYYCLAFASVLSIALPALTSPVFADTTQDLINQSQCKQATGSPIQCVQNDPKYSKGDPAVGTNCQQAGTGCNLVERYVNPLINLLAIMAGIAVVIGIIIGGIQYASSAGDPQKAAAGKKHIVQSIIALITFFFLYALLGFLIPGKGLLVG